MALAMAAGARCRVVAAKCVAGRSRVGAAKYMAGGLAQAYVAGRVIVSIARIHAGLVLRLKVFVCLVRGLIVRDLEGGGVAGV